MATNIELKASYQDLGRAKGICRALGAKHTGTDFQLDTYFKVPSGRFKLRESTLTGNSLIFYERKNEREPKESDYLLVRIEGEPTALRQLLAHALGLLVQVRKKRDVFILGNTRIHLDNVESLGRFVEFEYLVSNNGAADNSAKELRLLRERLNIAKDDLIDVSYGDLVLRSVPSLNKVSEANG